MPPATGHSHDAIEALQATLLASHLAAKLQCLLHALSWIEGQTAGSAWPSGQAGSSLVPPAEVLTLGQAEDDRGVESVSSPQSIHHPGWRESIGVEQLSIRAQGIGALLSPSTDEHSPARPST